MPTLKLWVKMNSWRFRQPWQRARQNYGSCSGKQQELATAEKAAAGAIAQTQQEIQEQTQALEKLGQEHQNLETRELSIFRRERDDAKKALDRSREDSSAVAAASDAWIQEQAALRHQIEALLKPWSLSAPSRQDCRNE